MRAERGKLWNVFLGAELIDHFESREDANRLAHKVSTKTGREEWVTSDGVTFKTISRA